MTTAPNQSSSAMVRVDQLVESPTNPRKRFDKKSLDHLAARKLKYDTDALTQDQLMTLSKDGRKEAAHG